MDTNMFLVIEMKYFVYGIKIFGIDKYTLKTKFSKIEKPQKDESIEECLERIMLEYNTTEFVFRANFDVSSFEEYLIDRGFYKYNLPKGA